MALANLNAPRGMSLVWLLYQAATPVSGKASSGERLWRHYRTCWLAIDVPIVPKQVVLSAPRHLWLDLGEHPTTAKSGWPTLLTDSDDACTQSKVTALQPRKISALVDKLTEGSGAAGSTILHLSGSQAARCFDSDSRHILTICTAHGARDRPIPDSIPLEEEEDSRT
jgi:hypothetical protein